MPDIDATLLVTLTLLTFLSACLPLILKPILMCFWNKSSQEKEIHNEMMIYKSEQRKISMQHDFAAHAKLQRKIIKLEDGLKELAEARSTRKLKYKLMISYSFQAVIGVALFMIALWYRYTPVCVLEQSLFPLNRVFGYPIDIPNAISPHAWIILSRVSFTLLIKQQ